MNPNLIHIHLAAAVPLRIHELRQLPDSAVDAIRAGLPERLQQGADAMLFGTAAPGEAGRAVGAWTTALALLALTAEGGVDFAGRHWCPIPHCRATSRYEHAAPNPDGLQPRDPHPEPRPVHDLPDLSVWPPPAA
jgi:hypothetical protein